MRTDFTQEQLADPDIAQSEKILRTCTHCGFCTATCPTYLLLGDELDSPRGRIYLIKDMLARGEPPAADTVKHIDRCLSCLACMTTCPSGVNYMHLVDHARRWIEEKYRRPPGERALRCILGAVLARPSLFRLALRAANFARPFAALLPQRLAPLLALAPRSLPRASPAGRSRVYPAEGERRMRVALLAGCAQQVLMPEINASTIRLLTRHGCEVVVAQGSGCCGSLNHHLGQESAALTFTRANIDAWERERLARGLDAIAVNASGCGTTVKDYRFMLREDPAYAEKAARIADLARDVTEIIARLGLRAPSLEQFPERSSGPPHPAPSTLGSASPTLRSPLPPQGGEGRVRGAVPNDATELGTSLENRGRGLRVAYHSACSMQHGQQLHHGPKALLAQAGFEVVEVPEGHVCCGSAGTYNLLQPEIAERLCERKLANIASTAPDIVATGNIGCITQLAQESPAPVLHTAQLLDWATGGPEPEAVGALYQARHRAAAGIRSESASAAAPITVGMTQPSLPRASRSPAAPRSTQAIVIGN
jgi:glycolate oxidase iron-sulfur subunit